MWLAEQGRLGAVAAALDIHPQTARYRLGRLRELFGDALEDPDGRFWLELALRARRDDQAAAEVAAGAAGSGTRLCAGTSGPSAPEAISSAHAYVIGT